MSCISLNLNVFFLLLQSCSVVDQEQRFSHADKKSFVVYQIRVSFKDQDKPVVVWSVGRRYKQFFELHEWLSREHELLSDALPSFPPKLGGAALRMSRLDAWISVLTANATGGVAARVRDWVGADGRPTLLYRTASICGVCVIGEGASVQPLAAQVVTRNHAVFLECVCARHGLQSTLYSTDQFFFERMLAFALPESRAGGSVDIEQLGERMMYAVDDAPLPFMMELGLVQSGTKELLSWKLIEREFNRLRKIQGDRRFVVRCAAKGFF
jgi:hypothetical protein